VGDLSALEKNFMSDAGKKGKKKKSKGIEGNMLDPCRRESRDERLEVSGSLSLCISLPDRGRRLEKSKGLFG